MYQAETHKGKQQQKIFDCRNEPEALAKIQAQYYKYIMKNLFLSLAFMLIGSFTFANNGGEITNLEKKAELLIVLNHHPNNESLKLNLKFNDLDDIEKIKIDDIIPISYDEECTVDITVSVTVSVGIASATVELKVKDVPCSSIKTRVKQMVTEAKEAASAAL